PGRGCPGGDGSAAQECREALAELERERAALHELHSSEGLQSRPSGQLALEEERLAALERREAELEAESLRLRGERSRLMQLSNDLRARVVAAVGLEPAGAAEPLGHDDRMVVQELQRALARLQEQNRALRAERARVGDAAPRHGPLLA
ncbi:unnamed protein product, partial [Prorocentrum cordatum]